MPAKEKRLRRNFHLGSCVSLDVLLVCPPCPNPVCNGGCISCCRAVAGEAGFWSVPPQGGQKPPQIHLSCFLSPLGCPGAVTTHCTACEKSLSSTGQVLTVRMVKTLTMAEPNASGPCWDMSIPNQVPFCGFASILLYPPTSAAQGLQDKPRALRWDRQQQRSGMGLEAQRAAAFFCSMPHGSGVTGSSAEGTQLARECWRVRWQWVIFPPLLHGLHLFSACPFQQGEQFGYTLPTWQSVL